jgi:hypothetical protein
MALEWEIQQAKKRFGLPEAAPVLSCYEAGRDGFWLHRYLMVSGIENLVVDSASIEVNRRAKRAKTDRLDVGKLVTMLIRYHSGEKRVWSVVHVPSVEAEDKRHLHRELGTLKSDRTRHTNPPAGQRRLPGKAGAGTLVGRLALAAWVAVTAETGICLLAVCEPAYPGTGGRAGRDAPHFDGSECGTGAPVVALASHWGEQRLAVRDGVLWLASVPQST